MCENLLTLKLTNLLVLVLLCLFAAVGVKAQNNGGCKKYE